MGYYYSDQYKSQVISLSEGKTCSPALLKFNQAFTNAKTWERGGVKGLIDGQYIRDNGLFVVDSPGEIVGAEVCLDLGACKRVTSIKTYNDWTPDRAVQNVTFFMGSGFI